MEVLISALERTSNVQVVSRSDEATDLLQARVEADIVLVDVVPLVAKDPMGTRTLATIVAADDQAKVIALVDGSDVETVFAAAAAGVHAVLGRMCDPEDLMAAVVKARTNAIVVDRLLVEAISGGVWHDLGRVPASHPLSSLTARETEVLVLLTKGCRVPMIARELGLSIHTVRVHVKSILTKLRCHSQLEAVALATSLAIGRRNAIPLEADKRAAGS